MYSRTPAFVRSGAMVSVIYGLKILKTLNENPKKYAVVHNIIIRKGH